VDEALMLVYQVYKILLLFVFRGHRCSEYEPKIRKDNNNLNARLEPFVFCFNLAAVNSMGLRRQIGNFFGFTRAQVNAFLLLLPLLVIFIFSEPVYRRLTNSEVMGNTEKIKLDSLLAYWKASETEPMESKHEPAALFYFDPNTASYDELRALGFPERLAKQLITYRSKGGRFREAKDILKLYGMDVAFANQLIPWIVIPPVLAPVKPAASGAQYARVSELFDLNQADTLQLQQLKGIGPVLARRIVKYREALGGFVSRGQLAEVYGLDSAVVRHINERCFLVSDFIPRQININEATEGQLAAHPYISKAVARAIVTYRFQHGRYAAVDQLAAVRLITEETYQKVKPYLTVE
jgi:DNA uptake protein ComE-like DNA-binding protein